MTEPKVRRTRKPVSQTTESGRAAALPATARQRVTVEALRPILDAGRFPIKRTLGEMVDVRARIFTDGHDLLAGVLRYRPAGRGAWRETPLAPLGNDEWGASFEVSALGAWEYTVEAWIDRFGTWLAGLVAKADAGQDVSSELIEGAALVDAAAAGDAALLACAARLRGDAPQDKGVAAARDADLGARMAARPDREHAAAADRVLGVAVDRVRARYGAWYEMFPRSASPDPSRSGTFAEAEGDLPRIAAMGFDVLYLPPIHPIGHTHRKGRNNALAAGPADLGSPWAIGSPAGGHTAIDPGLGSLADFGAFAAAARDHGLEVALDIAFQASPDHPWVREHPAWFRHRPDGSIKYAENPPKKYQDIYPFDFDNADWEGLWRALRAVFLFWIGQGVRIFRVDNPHTKSFRFWEWCLADLRQAHPDTIFLAEAFTRPAVMHYLAKAGFNQSYTYFTWRNTAAELREYLTELTATDAVEYMRPNLFANTPDILHAYLQQGGPPAFAIRLILAAMLGASYGIYSGFELGENVPVHPGSEEYLDSEKYEVRARDWRQPWTLMPLVTRINEIRRAHPALQTNAGLRFHRTDNPALLWFSKQAGADRVFVVVTTDPQWLQHGWLAMPIDDIGLAEDARYDVEDLLDGRHYAWRGRSNYVRLDPKDRVAHVFVVRPHPQP